MVKLIASSEIGKMFDTGDLTRFIDSQTNPHQQLLAWLGGNFDLTTWTPSSISSTMIVVDGNLWGNVLYNLEISGTGIDPVTSFADFQAAVSTGLANGDFNSIVIRGQNLNTPDVAGAEILNIALSPTGYTMTSAGQVISITGSLPTSLSQVFALSQIANQMAIFDTLTAAEQTQIITGLNAYGITDFSISSGGIEVFSMATTATEASMTVMGYKIALTGSFSSGFGDAVMLLQEVSTALQTGAPVDFSNIAGTSVTKLKVFKNNMGN